MDSKDQDAVNAVAKIMLPMIKKVTPALMAQQILSVQPMTWPLSSLELRLGTAYLGGSKEGDWHTVYVVKPFSFAIKGELKDSNKHLDWCKATFGDESNSTWFMRDNRYYFRNEADQAIFVLRWTE